MGYKILDVKADIHEDVEKLMKQLEKEVVLSDEFVRYLREDVLHIVDEHFEKIER